MSILEFWTSNLFKSWQPTSSPSGSQEEAFVNWLSFKASEYYPHLKQALPQSEFLSDLVSMSLQLIHLTFTLLQSIPPPLMYLIASYFLMRLLWSLLKSTVKQVYNLVKFVVKVAITLTLLVLILKVLDILPIKSQ